ncbi:Mu transposase C-terminal domain-containing protein [Undibacterium sp. TS12]|uniref:Mu transposase C-terminal domain-containing protein n=1 Tax=Undibacterium sp. TS12 TaxID=2908202 RepID=UPI001F4CD1F4|nr:Mu transposase C-terminal domain-containing protein [Undibacterium sp. TS12]MCH8618031.1 Mu transposase C-terminal domain-containing protein [Undibacterium sp. TS12]
MTNPAKELYPGLVFEKDGITYCIRRVSKRRKMVTVVSIDQPGGEEVDFSFEEMTGHQHPNNMEPSLDLDHIDPHDWNIALERCRLVRALLALPERTEDDVKAVATAALVHTSTVYRWIEKFQATPRVSVFLRAPRNDKGTTKLSAEVEQIIAHVIGSKLLTDQKLKPSKAFREVEMQCKDLGYEVPHENTFLARVRQISPVLMAKKRHGKNAALALRPILGTIPWQDTPYSLIQIDHTPVDIILVDSVHRLPLKRPWLTLAIDVNSRMVAGYYIAFDSPGTLGTGICVSNLILPKEPLLAKFGIQTNWPCQGIPGIIHLDNAREFRGNTLKMACNEYNIELKFRQVKRPQYGAHIERMMGTFMSEVHALPGTTFSNSGDLEDYEPEKEAAMTLFEFEKWLLNVIRAYHNRNHSELNMSPLQKFLQGLSGDDEHPGVGVLPSVQDADKLRIDFLPMERRSVQPYGIQLDNIFYFADVLTRWIGSREPGKSKEARKFLIRRDPRDVSYILFYDPDLRRYFRIPYANVSHPSISLWELRVVHKYLNDQGKNANDEDELFKAYREMQKIAEGAKASTKQVQNTRLAAERKSTVLRHPTPLSIPQKVKPVEGPQSSIFSETILPFDEVDKA